MATEFGPQITQTSDLQSAVTPQQGVAKQPVLLKGLASLFDQAGAALEAKRSKDATNNVSEFTKRQLLVAEALDQGKISSSAHARTLMRKNLLDAIDANPGLAAEYIKAQTSIIGLPGGADIVQEGNEEEQLQRRRRQGLVDAGLLAYDADESTFRKTDLTVRTAEEASRQHQMRMQTLDEELKQQNVSEGRRKEIEAEKEQATIDFLRSAAPAEYLSFENQMKSILNDPNLSEAEKVNAINDYYNQWQANMSDQFGEISEHRGKAFAKPIEQYYQTYLARAKGEINDEAVERASARIIATGKLAALEDPTIAGLVVTSALVNSDQFLQVMSAANPEVQRAFNRFIAGSSVNNRTPESPITSQPDSKAALKQYLSAVSKGLTEAKTDEEASELMTRFREVLDGVTDYEGLLRKDPKAGIELVNWMASPDFLKIRQEHPELFEDVSDMQSVLESNYHDEVWEMVQREFTDANVVVMGVSTGPQVGLVPEVVPTTSGVGVRTTSSGVEFFSLDPDNRDLVKEARRLNKELRPVINNTLKAGAHLEGRTDYGALWDQVATDFLGGEGIRETGGGDEGDELILQDFQERARPILNLTNSSNLLSLMDKHEGGGDYNTLLGHAQRGGKEFEGVNVSNMSIGQVINFSRSGGEYANYSRRKVGRVATPMGRYQIVGQTLRRVAGAMGLSMNTPFDAQTQDAMFSYLAQEALAGKRTMRSKRSALRGVWEGFKYASDEELDRAIMEFESGS